MVSAAPVVLFVLLVLAIILAIPIYRCVTLPRSVPPRPSCGKCAYPIEGLATPTCPECGSSLLAVGVQTPALVLKHRSSLISALLCWTIILLVLGLYSSAFIAGLTRSVGSRPAPAAINTATIAHVLYTTDPALKPLTITATVTGPSNRAPDTVHLVFTLDSRDNGTYSLIYNQSNPAASLDSFTITDDAGSTIASGSPLTIADIQTWAATAGIEDPTARSAFADAINAAIPAILVAPQQQPPYQIPGYGIASSAINTTSATAPIAVPAARSMIYLVPFIWLGLWFLLWILGLWFIPRRRRTLMARGHAAVVN